MSSNMKSPCRSCEQVNGLKDVCRHFCQAMLAFHAELNEFTKATLGCYEKTADTGDLPLGIETERQLKRSIEKDRHNMGKELRQIRP